MIQKSLINSFLIFLGLATLAHLGVWFQINAQFISPKFKNNTVLLTLVGIPISFLWITATRYGVAAFDGKLWPQRLIAFSIGIVLYTILTMLFFGEKFEARTVVSLVLAFSIVFVQVFWK